MFYNKKQHKVFCIGFNKTGTTTLEQTLIQLGYKMGNQAKGELLFLDWFKRDFKSIIKHCNTADAFQDIPFSLPYTFMMLDQYYKNAKFVLTVRDSELQWYESLTKFHSKLWGEGKRLPTAEDMKNATYRYRGFTYESFKLIYNTPDDDLYNKAILTKLYKLHNYTVEDYFRGNPEKFLIINVSKSSDYAKLCTFLGKPVKADDFPWKNKTSDL